MRSCEDGWEAEGYCGGERGGGVAAEEEGEGIGELCGEHMIRLSGRVGLRHGMRMKQQMHKYGVSGCAFAYERYGLI